MKELIRNIPDHEACGVYALVDENGKVYIGSSKNIRKRMIQHNSNLNKILLGYKPGTVASIKLSNAVLSGHIFSCSILKECDPDSIDAMHILENEYIIYYGGVENTYNGRGNYPLIFPTELSLELNRYVGCGIFCLTNTVNKRSFVTRSINVKTHIVSDCTLLMQHKFHCTELQNDYNRGYPIKIDILEMCEKSDLDDEFYKYIYLIGLEHCYNHPSMKNADEVGKYCFLKNPILFSDRCDLS